MQIAEINDHINEFLAEPLILSSEEVQMIKRVHKLIMDDIDKMVKGEKLEQNDNKIVTVIDTVMMISRHVLSAPMNDTFTKFVTAFSEMVYNWNNNLYQDELLRQMPLYMGRMAETRTSMIKVTKIIKDVDERMRDLSTWNPPAYEIAIDYFEKLLKENEKEQVTT